MHQPVKDNLEEYLRGMDGKSAGAVSPDMEAHLQSCGNCVRELRELERQTAALRALRAPADLEPRAGFYARVLQRIDGARAANTVWAAFLDPAFAKRLVFACGTLVVVLGTYLISTEPGKFSFSQPTPAIASAQQTGDSDNGTTAQERDAVLVNLAAYQQ